MRERDKDEGKAEDCFVEAAAPCKIWIWVISSLVTSEGEEYHRKISR